VGAGVGAALAMVGCLAGAGNELTLSWESAQQRYC
jgi:hypothetical protein